MVAPLEKQQQTNKQTNKKDKFGKNNVAMTYKGRQVRMNLTGMNQRVRNMMEQNTNDHAAMKSPPAS